MIDLARVLFTCSGMMFALAACLHVGAKQYGISTAYFCLSVLFFILGLR